MLFTKILTINSHKLMSEQLQSAVITKNAAVILKH